MPQLCNADAPSVTQALGTEVPRDVLPHLAAGCVAGVAAARAIVVTNVGSLRNLILRTHGGRLAAALLTFEFVVTFGSAAMGHAIMRIGQNEE